MLQIVAGAVVGPQLLGWARDDAPVRVLSVVGLAFLLLLAGLEIDFDRLRGQVPRLTSVAFAVSFALAVVMGLILFAAGLVRSPLLIAVILAATSLGVILPTLADSGQLDTPFGQVVVAGASIAELLPVVLLSLLFSEDGSGIASQLTLLDRDQAVTHSLFRVKLRAVGFGAFVPFFFVSTGLSLDLHGLASPGTLARVPVFLAGLLVVRGVPALLYRPLAARPAQLAAAGLLQATSISIPIVAGTIGVDLGLIRPETTRPSWPPGCSP